MSIDPDCRETIISAVRNIYRREIFLIVKYFRCRNICPLICLIAGGSAAAEEVRVINGIELTEQERAMLRVMNRMKRVPFPRLYPNLSPAEADLLSIVRSRDEGARVSEIAQALELPMPAVSRLLKSLEERELIVRTVLPKDRRSIVVTLTPQGEQTLQEMKECMHAFLCESLEGVDPEEFDQMIREWDHLLDRMDALFLRYRQNNHMEDT